MKPSRARSQPRDRRPYAAGVLSGLASVLLGTGWRDALLVGLVVLVVVLTGIVVTRRSERYRWPPAPDLDAGGTRREVTDVTWTFAGVDGRVSEEAVRRLRSDATRRLARRGVVIPGGLNSTTPRTAAPEVVGQARALLGDRVWRILTSPGGRMPSLDDVAHCVDVVERLHHSAQAPEAPESPEGPVP